MSTVIWKYYLALTDDQVIRIPDGSIPLSVQDQGDAICLWVQVDADAKVVEQTIHIYGTGHPIDTARSDEFHIGTVQMHYTVFDPDADNTLVWHVFWVVS